MNKLFPRLSSSHKVLSTGVYCRPRLGLRTMSDSSSSVTQPVTQELPKISEEGSRHGIIVRDVSVDPTKVKKKLRKRARVLLLESQRQYIREVRRKALLGMEPVTITDDNDPSNPNESQLSESEMKVEQSRVRLPKPIDRSHENDFDAWLEARENKERENEELKKKVLISENKLSEIGDFHGLGVGSAMVNALQKNLSISVPSDIQRSVIPVLLRKFGLLKLSDEFKQYSDIRHSLEITLFADGTGTGKTLAYVIPLLESIRHDEVTKTIPLRVGRPRALILAPSRELCHQIRRVVRDTGFGVRSLALTAGESGKSQYNKLMSGVDIVVGTPDRILEHLNTNPQFHLSDLRYLIFDEVDCLFHECDWDKSITPIISAALPRYLRTSISPAPSSAPPSSSSSSSKSKPTPVTPRIRLNKNLHMIGSSGTLTEDDRTALLTSLRQINPRMISASAVENIAVVSGTNSLHNVLSDLPLYFYECTGVSQNKHEVLLEVLRQHEKRVRKGESEGRNIGGCSQVMIFCRTKGSAASVGHFLSDHSVRHEMFFGVHSPHLRSEKYAKFLSGECRILVCTDAAMRGLDTTQVSHVILFDFPHNARSFIHRVGRTGRAKRIAANKDDHSALDDRVTGLIGRRDSLMAGALLTALAERKSHADTLDLISHLNDRGLQKMKHVFKVNPHIRVQSRASDAGESSSNPKLVPFEFMAVSRMSEDERNEKRRQSRAFRRLTPKQKRELQRREKMLKQPSLWFYRPGRTRMPHFGVKKRLVKRLVRVSDDDVRKRLLDKYSTPDTDADKRRGRSNRTIPR